MAKFKIGDKVRVKGDAQEARAYIRGRLAEVVDEPTGSGSPATIGQGFHDPIPEPVLEYRIRLLGSLSDGEEAEHDVLEIWLEAV